MIRIEEAIDLILGAVEPLPPELVPLDASVGRVTAEAVKARWELPPHDNSAMDGYAFRFVEAGAEPLRLRVVEEIGAGHPTERVVGPGEAIKIMTGAPLPSGSDTVVPVEDTARAGDVVEVTRLPKRGANVRHAGEDVKEGEEVIPSGVKIRPAEVGMLASLGRSMIRVHQRPRVAILSTGDEIVEVDEALDRGRGKIVNSNSHGLAAQVLEAGGLPMMLGIGRDDPDGLVEMLERARAADMVLTTGGVSMGDYDYVRGVFERWGVSLRFGKVAIKPGKPVVFGMKGRVPVFGLPGNPVSAMVSFEQFVRPAIRKLSGCLRLFRPVLDAELGPDVEKIQAKEGRMEFVRCRVERFDTGYRVMSVKKRSSGMLSTLVKANGLVILPPSAGELGPGDRVRVQIYDYEFLEGFLPGW